MRRCACIALVLLAPVAIVGSGAAAQVSGTIVFSSNRDGDYDIYAVNPDGTGLTRLTRNDVEDSAPLPSPNGKLIAFFSEEAGLAVMNADGSGRHRMHGCGLLPQSWSPDSTRLVCEKSSGDGLAITDAADGTATSLTGRGWEPRWSPDGRTVAFVDRVVDPGLWAVPAAGGRPRRLSRQSVDGRPAWSPDSQRIAYAAAGAGGWDDLFTIGADGSDERRLVKDVEPVEPVEWSPQGSLISFTRRAAVYTVRPDGGGLHRVSISRAGESSNAASWSSDGTRLVYERQRFNGAFDRDIFVARPDAGPGRAVTSPYPAGGTNGEARWMPGPLLPTPSRPPTRTLALSPARKLTFAAPVANVATDGNRAVAYTDSCRKVLLWEPLVRRTVRLPSLCPGEGAWHLRELVLAGRRLAWIMGRGSASGDHSSLWTLLPAARKAADVIETITWNDGSEGSATIDHLRGRGGTIAFTSTDYGGRTGTRRPWLLVARGGGRCPWRDPSDDFTSKPVCRRLADGVTAAVDAGRVLTVAPGGIVRLLSKTGAVRRQWTLGPGITEAKLRGRTLAVQRGSSITLYDTATGSKTRTRPLLRDEGRPLLLDVQGGLAVYTTGGAIHLLRLSDGRDLALTFPQAAPPFDARLEPAGLFVVWNRLYDRRPGRLGFVPLRTLTR